MNRSMAVQAAEGFFTVGMSILANRWKAQCGLAISDLEPGAVSLAKTGKIPTCSATPSARARARFSRGCPIAKALCC